MAASADGTDAALPAAETEHPIRLPAWAQVTASVVIAFHLVAVTASVLAIPTGPWVVFGGTGMASPPRFADRLVDAPPIRGYLQALHLTDGHRSLWNGVPEQARIEAVLLDDNDKELGTLTFPDAKATGTVRQRQLLMALALNSEEMLPPATSEEVPAPGAVVDTVSFFRSLDGRKFERVEIDKNLLPRNRNNMTPTDWAMINARSFGRYLTKKHNATKVELRVKLRPIMPPDWVESPPGGTNFTDIVKILGVFYGGK